MTILAIDPGSEQSAYVLWDGSRIYRHGIEPNESILGIMTSFGDSFPHKLAVELVSSYGMPVGADVFQTCIWIGRFMQVWLQSHPSKDTVQLISRADIKMHLCQTMRAKDKNIRQVLIDRLGEPGTKKAPGILHGIHTHEWAAMAVAVTASDILNSHEPAKPT